jgi:hypothetical protein
VDERKLFAGQTLLRRAQRNRLYHGANVRHDRL